ncbi:MAG: NAD(P)-dependent oxidoreductase, partial [Phycisphaerales bacterium]|nr:NAD(P)-dependent oxidoreductase [Phycisphaerales bacterium]
MRVAITGGSGFIGSVAIHAIARAGHSVTALVRPESRRDHIEASVDRFVVGEHDDESAWPQLLEGAEVVVHSSVDWPALHSGDEHRHLRSNLLGSIRLLHASRPLPFVYLSSIAVHHDMRPRWEGRVDEDHPLRPSSAYGALKAALESHLWAEHFGQGRATTALRPCAVYGIDPTLERSHGYEIIRMLRARKPFQRSGGGKFVHVDDVAAAIVACLGNPLAAGRPFNLVDCYARWSDLAQMAAEELAVDASIDHSSPPEPRNMFTKDAAASLGVRLDRGHAGIRT